MLKVIKLSLCAPVGAIDVNQSRPQVNEESTVITQRGRRRKRWRRGEGGVCVCGGGGVKDEEHETRRRKRRKVCARVGSRMSNKFFLPLQFN